MGLLGSRNGVANIDDATLESGQVISRPNVWGGQREEDVRRLLAGQVELQAGVVASRAELTTRSGRTSTKVTL